MYHLNLKCMVFVITLQHVYNSPTCFLGILCELFCTEFHDISSIFKYMKIFYRCVSFQKIIANRPALGVFPGKDWPNKLKRILLKKEVTHTHTYTFYTLFIICFLFIKRPCNFKLKLIFSIGCSARFVTNYDYDVRLLL